MTPLIVAFFIDANLHIALAESAVLLLLNGDPQLHSAETSSGGGFHSMIWDSLPKVLPENRRSAHREGACD